MTFYEEQEDGEFIFPMKDPEHPEKQVWGHLFFSDTGISFYAHRRKPQDNSDRVYTQMCGVYIEFYNGKVQAQLYDEVGEQHDDIHYVCSGDTAHNESIVLVGNVEQWKPETGENDEEGVS